VDVGDGVIEYQLNSNNVGGTQPHGTILFIGTFTSLAWRSTSNEDWNGFTVGAQGSAIDVCLEDPSLPGCSDYPSEPLAMYWVDWTGSDLDSGSGFECTGTIATSPVVTVTYSNPQGIAFYQPTGGADYWRGGDSTTSPYTSFYVENRPTGTDIIALRNAGSQTLTFSQEIVNPIFAFVSLNGNGYGFDQDFEILSYSGLDGRVCGYWGCGGVYKAVVDVGGVIEYQLNCISGEPHGTIRFLDSFSTLTWRSQSNENWNGFTLGVSGTA
jgi:hypothetical protein